MLFSIKDLAKSFNNNEIFSNLNLDINKNKITAFFGPNGCGKTTLFNILVKITKKDSGEITLNATPSYMFQNYSASLLPWKTNYNNLAFPLIIQGLNKKVIKQQVTNIYNLYNFNIDLEAYPYELSGGQRQFLAFLRSIITNPKILLLDEPFSSLDYENSFLLAKKLQEYYLRTKSTILVITHNIEEAVYLADEIIVFSRKPTKIIGKIKNPLPYPRTVDMIKSDTFNKIKNQVLEIFQSEAKL